MLKQAIQTARIFSNPFKAIADRLGWLKSKTVIHTLRNGLKFVCRPGSSDVMSVLDIFSGQNHSSYLGQFKIKDGDFVVDIGANIGVFSVQAASMAKGVKVEAYEPMPDTAEICKINAILNDLNIEVFQLAVGSEDGKRVIKSGAKNHSMSASFFSNPDTSEEEFSVSVISFHSILNKHKRIDMLKIDCEGAEFEFMPKVGTQELIRVEKIALEYHEFKPEWNHEELERILMFAGFQTRVYKWKPKFGIIYAWR